MHGEAVLVDEAGADQAVADACAAEDDDVPARLGRELGGSPPRAGGD